jgi:hypothetical protein
VASGCRFSKNTCRQTSMLITRVREIVASFHLSQVQKQHGFTTTPRLRTRALSERFRCNYKETSVAVFLKYSTMFGAHDRVPRCSSRAQKINLHAALHTTHYRLFEILVTEINGMIFTNARGVAAPKFLSRIQPLWWCCMSRGCLKLLQMHARRGGRNRPKSCQLF